MSSALAAPTTYELICDAERRSSALHRIKTWLRTTMNQQRLGNQIMCRIQYKVLPKLSSTKSLIIPSRKNLMEKFGKKSLSESLGESLSLIG